MLQRMKHVVWVMLLIAWASQAQAQTRVTLEGTDSATNIADIEALIDAGIDIKIAGADPLAEVTSATLQNAATANGNGTLLTANGYGMVRLTVNCNTCSGGTLINFEGSEDGTNFFALTAQLAVSPYTIATTTTTSGLTYWIIPIQGVQHVRARISAYSAGTVTVTGRAVFAPVTIEIAKVEDVAHADADLGMPMLTRRIDTAASSAGTSADYATLNTDSLGRVWTSGATVEDAAETAGDVLVAAGTVRRDTAASSAGASGDNATLNTDGLGRLWVRPGGPCEDHARVSSAAIDTAASGNVEIVALNGSDLIYICAIDVVVDAAVDIQLIYGTGTACATGETNLTGAWGFAANGGISKTKGTGPYYVVPAGNAFCIETSGAVQTSGSVTYVRTAAP